MDTGPQCIEHERNDEHDAAPRLRDFDAAIQQRQDLLTYFETETLLSTCVVVPSSGRSDGHLSRSEPANRRTAGPVGRRVIVGDGAREYDAGVSGLDLSSTRTQHQLLRV